MPPIKLYKQAGFTLLEVLIAVLIIGIISGTLFGITSSTIGPSRIAEQKMDMDRMGRFIIGRLRQDLRGATTLPLSERGSFIGLAGRQGKYAMDELHFTSFARLYITAVPSGGSVELGWYFKGSGEQRTLARREAEDIDEVVTVGGISFGISKDVKELKIRYLKKLGGNEWQKSWDSRQQQRKMPAAVWVELTLKHGERQRFYSTMVKLES